MCASQATLADLERRRRATGELEDSRRETDLLTTQVCLATH